MNPAGSYTVSCTLKNYYYVTDTPFQKTKDISSCTNLVVTSSSCDVAGVYTYDPTAATSVILKNGYRVWKSYTGGCVANSYLYKDINNYWIFSSVLTSTSDLSSDYVAKVASTSSYPPPFSTWNFRYSVQG